MTESTPNTQGDSWDERFDALEIQDGRIALYKRQVKTLIREVISKERAEGERRGAEKAVNYIQKHLTDASTITPGVWYVLDSTLKEARTLPADSTEGLSNDNN
jgi:hypothetical protein